MQHIDLTQVSLCQDNSRELGGREPSRLGQAKLTDERYQPDVSTELNSEMRGCHDGCSPLGGEDNTPSCARELAKVAAPQHPPTGIALLQDGTLNLVFIANALRFYANHIEGHPQRGDYFPADLRLAAQMLVADTPPPSSHVAPIRYVPAKGNTRAEMVENFRADPLYREGDAWLVFANEGDLHMQALRHATAPAPSQHVAPDEDVVETVAGRIYEDAHKGMANIWAWNDRGLDDEHPGTRERYLGYARSAIAATPAPSQYLRGADE